MEEYDPDRQYPQGNDQDYLRIRRTSIAEDHTPSPTRRRPPPPPLTPPPVTITESFQSDSEDDGALDALREGLNFALEDGNWFPTSPEKKYDPKPDHHPRHSHDDESVDYTHDIPMKTLAPPAVTRPSLRIDTSIPHDFEQALPKIQINDEEPGFLEVPGGPPPSSPDKDRPKSPHSANITSGKFQDLFARISDRIAGEGDEPDEDEPSGNESQLSVATQSPRPTTPLSSNFKNVSMESLKSPAPDGTAYFAAPSYQSSKEQEEASLLHHTGGGGGGPHPPNTYNDETMFLFGNSVGIFSPSSNFRQWCNRIISNSWVNKIMFLLLALQVALLSYRQWNPPVLDGYFYKGNNWADYLLIVINFIYTMEIIGKIIAYGLYDDRQMYTELGLEYPENIVKSMFFQKKYLINFLDSFGLSRLTRLVWPKEKAYHNHHDDHQPLHARLHAKERSWRSIWKDPSHIDPGENSDDYDLLADEWSPSSSRHPSRRSSFSSINAIGAAGAAPPLPDSFSLNHANTFFIQRHKYHKLNLKRAFLRNSWHRIDFVSMVCFWISLLLSINRYDVQKHIMIFRALSCLRILRFCNLTAGTTTVLTSIKYAMPQLIDVGIFIVCFWILFGIIGVQSFKMSLTRHCEWTNPNDPSDTFINEDQYCGSWLATNGTVMDFIMRDGSSSGQAKGFKCPVHSRCVSGENPYNGTLDFDNILQSMEIVFVTMSANTFTDIMYYTMDSDSMVACLFFIACIFFCTVWLINVFIAVIVASFNVTTSEHAKRRNRPPTKLSRWLGGSDAAAAAAGNQLKTTNWRLRWFHNFEFIFILVTICSLLTQCFRTAYLSDDELERLFIVEFVCTLILMVEIIIRFGCYLPHWRQYIASRSNVVDTLLAVVTTVIIIPPVRKGLGQVYYWLTVFQLLRIYRVVLFTRWSRRLWVRLMGNIQSIFNLGLFYFILTYLVAIICARYFEGQVSPDEMDLMTDSFPMHTLPNAFVALYTITSTENWTEIMYYLQKEAVTTSQRAFGSILFVFWFIFSNTIILNVFIAVISKTMEVSEEDKRRNQLMQFIDNMTHRLTNIADVDMSALRKWKSKIFGEKFLATKGSTEQAVINLLLSGSAINDFILEQRQDPPPRLDHDVDDNHHENKPWRDRAVAWVRRGFAKIYEKWANPFYEPKFHTKNPEAQKILDNFNPSQFAQEILKERSALQSKQDKFLLSNPKFNNVFYIITPRHPLRRFCQRLVKPSYGTRINGVEPNKKVSNTITVLMFCATVALVATTSYITPLYHKRMYAKYGTQYNWTFWIDVGFVSVFTTEFLVKIMADGFLFTPNAYCRSSWNIIDFVVLISMWIQVISFLDSQGNVVKVVRGLKALRAFRLLTISDTAKRTFHDMFFRGFTKIIEAGFIAFCLLFPFSIWGLNIFNGRLGYCLDGSSDMASCRNEYSNQVFNWDVVSPNVYVNPELKFNRFSDSLSSLFEIISLEGWVDLLVNVMASTGVGSPQEAFASPWNGIFVIGFNFISTVFILTLFISVIISNYSKVTGRAYHTVDQISYYQVEKILRQVKPSSRSRNPENLGRFRRFCYRLTVEKRSVFWNHFLNFLLFAHVLCLLLENFPSTTHSPLNTFRSVMFMVTTTCYFANSLMTLIAKGVEYFRNKWNIFYLLISTGAFVTMLISFIYANSHATVFFNINELFLDAMLVFIIPKSNRLSQLLRFASASLPALISLAFTWAVLFLVFAIAMCQIFGLTKVGPNGSDNLNFRSVPKALIVLFRMSFGEGWNYIMDDYTLGEPFCTKGHELDDSDCGNKIWARFLFIAWNLLSMYIFLNMFVSLILDSFSYISRKSGYSQLIERREIRKFKRAWQVFDPEGTGLIPPEHLVPFISELNASGSALSFEHFFYRGDLSIRRLTQQWIRRNNPVDPYDITVDVDRLDKMFSAIDWDKVKTRRHLVDMFIEECLMKMKLNNENGISFTSFLLQIPLYTAFEAGRCLDLTDFLERRLLLQKVEKSVKVKRVYELVSGYALRWILKKELKKPAPDSPEMNVNRLKHLSEVSKQRSPRHRGKSMVVENPFSATWSLPSDQSPNPTPYEPAEPLDTLRRQSDGDDGEFQFQMGTKHGSFSFEREDSSHSHFPSSPAAYGFGRDVGDTESLDVVETTIREVDESPGLGIWK